MQGELDEVSSLKVQLSEIHSVVKQIQSTIQHRPLAATQVSSLPATSLPDVLVSSKQNQIESGAASSAAVFQPEVISSSLATATGPIIGHLGRLVSLGGETEYFAGSTTGVHFIRSVELRWQKLEAGNESFPDSFFFVHLLRQPSALYAPVEQISLTTLSMSKDDYFARIDRFLLRWGRFWPVLCRKQALDAFGAAVDCLQNGHSSAHIVVDLYQLLLVLAIDAWDNQQDDSSMRYYRLAEEIELQSLMTCSLRSVQALILKSILHQLQGRHSQNISNIGTAVRAAQTIGLHRHPRRFKLCAGEMEFRTRLWWCIMVLDVYVCMLR